MKKKLDYLIVGQGLAGSFLAFQLLQENKSFMIVDKGLSFSSSHIAAGIINPLVLRRYTKTWRAEEFLEYNEGFYDKIHSFLSKKYHFKLPIKKLISSKEEEMFWHQRLKKEDLSDFIEPELKNGEDLISIKKHFKYGNVKQTSWLNISAFLEDFRKYLNSNQLLVEEEFEYTLLKNQQYKAIEFEKIIFCEGSKAKNNPFFPTNAFSLNKGQLMTIKSESLQSKDILKKKVFVLPIKGNEYKIGATYSWKWNQTCDKGNHEVETEKTEQLKDMFNEIFEGEYTIKNIEAGVRPAVKDRRPLIGKHPKKEHIYFFNGMGSKGCFMAPLLSKEFTNYLEKSQELTPDVNIQRYFLS
ncbi:MAG: FAD-dependent oxidoreductase [Flavobacteriales bacterium]|nr:FAD-dependent oxidoreductase [Flavobacteriales bacterium]